MKVRVSTVLDAPADRVWSVLRRVPTLVYINRGLIGVPDVGGWPEEFGEGMEVSTRLLFLHLIPTWEHHIAVVRVDEEKREAFTNEHGGAVRTWNHRIAVEPISEERSLYTDEVEIRAGAATPFVWLFAQAYYRYRQMRWRGLARVLA